MPFVADLHIHSHYSIATSKQLRPEFLDYWARIKGIKLVGTGDFTHPGWLNELKEKLEPAEPGLYKLRKEYFEKIPFLPESEGDISTRFMLTAEISNIYKKYDKVRKVHNVILAPDFETVEKIQQEFDRLGFNITSDGRPIIGMDSRDLLELVLNCSENIFFIPAHIWTPWFSALGAKSGFDTIRECYDDLADHIYAVETGLSSDPPMNWLCSFLDEYTLIANSDAHSPEKLGRNANLLDTELSYYAIIDAIKSANPKKFLGTIDFFPQEGKYHYAGHRKCNICWDPVETVKHHGICPVCEKPVTMGVLNRVVELSDRGKISERKHRLPFYSLIPLKEILAEILKTGPSSKKITKVYQSLIQKAGSEFNILLNHSLDEISLYGNELLTEAIRRMKNREVIIKEGFDGEFGHIKVFKEQELESFGSVDTLFKSSDTTSRPGSNAVGMISFDISEYSELMKKNSSETEIVDNEKIQDKSAELNSEQLKAVEHYKGPALVLAGPGTGKTKVLTERIVYLINNKNVKPDNILAITFTNKAAGEMRERVSNLMESNINGVTISTFHSFGYYILKKYFAQTGRKKNFSIVDEDERRYILQYRLNIPQKEIRNLSETISRFKQDTGFINITNEQNDLFERYQLVLKEYNLFDLDDLISETAKLIANNRNIQNDLQKQYTWILIDEYQDINRSQYNLIMLLTKGTDANLFAIGDPDQAIYGFRGADVRFINEFKQDFPSTKIFDLKTSYRCTDRILKVSHNILKKEGEAGKTLKGLVQGVKVKIQEEATDKSEAEFVARTIENMMGGLRFFSMDSKISSGAGDTEINSLSDFAVLFRTSRQIKVIEKAFNDHSIPYQAVKESSFFKSQEIRAIIDMVSLGLNPDNNLLKEKLHKNTLLHFFRTEELVQRIEQNDPLKFIPFLIDRFFIDPDTISKSDRKKLLEFANKYPENTEGFLKFAQLGVNIDTYQPDTEHVSLMTLHASKGLEFKCVFIVGCEDGLLPYSIFPDQKSDPEEERRLLYVGMTRAVKQVWLTHAKRRFLMGQNLRLNRSRFLNIIEKELFEISKGERKKQPPPDSQLELF